MPERATSSPHHPSAQELFTVKQVAQACGLPQPVVAQLVPRTWTEDGGMYTREQLELAIRAAVELRGPHDAAADA